MKIIEVTNLVKRYGEIHAVNDLSFYVEKGRLFAFLGPNGAGKSTTIDIICTLLKPDSGEVIIDGFKLGKDDDKIRSTIGVVFQDSILDPLLTVKENLQLRGSFYGLSKEKLRIAIKKAAMSAGVTEFLNRPYGKLSGGQRRRADIARALINTPKVLFMDEPTTGLDPQTRKSVWDTVQKLQKENDMTVFLTTHYMEEAAAADYVIVIDKGVISAKGTPNELKEQYSSDLIKLCTDKPQEMAMILDQLQISYEAKGDLFTIKLSKTLQAIPIIESCKEILTSFEVLNGTMDDAFIGIIGKGIRE